MGSGTRREASRADDGERTHRMSLTAFIDARSGVVVGWNLTDNPCSQSTLLALRHAIQRFGVPQKIYVDNGSEFLTHDVGGRGHRTRKTADLIKNPPPVFARLGIKMTNALVRNAKAKPIERTFGSLINTISRCFATYTGGDVTRKPESLKATLKRGAIPLDSELREYIADMIDGIYNVGAYGGAVKTDHGKRRIDVWNERIADVGQRFAAPDELDLMLLRSSRPQKVGRNGVHISVVGERLDYWDADMWEHIGREVYVRYDPADLGAVRMYEAETDRYIHTVPMARATVLKFDASREDVALAMAEIRKSKRHVRDKLGELTRLPAEQRLDMLDLQIRRGQAGREGFVIQPPGKIIPVLSGETPDRDRRAVGETVEVAVDLDRMNQAAEERRAKFAWLHGDSK